jgi:hypothetical protein
MILGSIFLSAADPFENYRFGEREGMIRSRACADSERIVCIGLCSRESSGIVNFRRFISPGEIKYYESTTCRFVSEQVRVHDVRILSAFRPATLSNRRRACIVQWVSLQSN